MIQHLIYFFGSKTGLIFVYQNREMLQLLIEEYTFFIIYIGLLTKFLKFLNRNL